MRQRNLRCSVPGCINMKGNTEITVFTLPKDPERAQCWLDQICVEVQPNEVIQVCEEHFEEALINRLNPKAIHLDLDAVPTLKLPESAQLDKTLSLPSGSKTNEQADLADSSVKEKRKIPIKDYTQAIKKIKTETNVPKEESQPAKLKTEDGYSVPCIVEIEPTLNLNNNNAFDDSDSKSKEKADSVVNSSERDNNEHAAASQETDSSPINTSNATKKTIQENQYGTITHANSYLVKLHNIYTHMEKVSLSVKAYKQLSLRLYLRFPNEYKTLYKALNALHKSELIDVFNDSFISIDRQALFGIYLNLKASTMSVKQKQCFLCIGEYKIKPRFYYDIKKDYFLGIHDLDKELKPEPATTAIVLMMQGIFEEWKQPISVAYVANNSSSIMPWIVKNIRRITDMGFNVRAVVPHRDTNYMIEDLSADDIHIIYCFHDVASLFISLYYHFTKFNFICSLNNSNDINIISCQYIVDCFLIEKNKKNDSLMSKLSENLLKPATIQELNIESVMNVFSMSTAAAISSDIDSRILDESAKETVVFITQMSKLYNILDNGCMGDKRKNGFVGDQSEIDHLTDMLKLLSNMKLDIQSNSAYDISYKALIEKFKTLIASVLSLISTLKIENYSHLPIWRFTDDAIDSFYEHVQKHSKSITKPTAKDVDSIFKQTAVIHLLKNHAKKIKPNDLDEVLTEFDKIVVRFKVVNDDFVPRKLATYSNIISSSEYMTLDMERKDGIIFLAGFLLKKCNEIHKCWILRSYNSQIALDLELLSMCENIMDDIRKNICALPGTEFIEFVETMEIYFRTFMNKDVLSVTKKRILNSLLKDLEAVNIRMPCACFPVMYLKKMYLRFRIYHTLKYNNELLKTKLRKRLIVNKL